MKNKYLDVFNVHWHIYRRFYRGFYIEINIICIDNVVKLINKCMYS